MCNVQIDNCFNRYFTFLKPFGRMFIFILFLGEGNIVSCSIFYYYYYIMFNKIEESLVSNCNKTYFLFKQRSNYLVKNKR